MTRFLLTIFLLLRTTTESFFEEEKRVKGLIQNWAPLVWLAPGERFLPLGVPEFLDNMQTDDEYLRTKVDVESLLRNDSSFLYGRKPAGTVPIYALVKNCVSAETQTFEKMLMKKGRRRRDTRDLIPAMIRTNDLSMQEGLEHEIRPELDKKKKKEKKPYGPRRLHFHVTYWMFYPFSEGKAVCVLDLGFFGSWPIPTLGGLCLGMLKEYGSHVGDWEHMSLYFEADDHPLAMYVSAHDAGAFYRFESRTGTFLYESQETRKGIFQKPIFPERVFTASGSHPVLFSARGSHGLWTAPGKHRFVRLPRLYDESGFGTAWPTWKKMEVLSDRENGVLPGWTTFMGKWGNPRSNCHPLARLGFNICQYVDGPTGILMKKSNFQC